MEAVPHRRMGTENLFFSFAQPGAQHSVGNGPLTNGSRVSSRPGSIGSHATEAGPAWFPRAGPACTRTSFASDPHAGSASVLKVSHHRNVSYLSVDAANAGRFHPPWVSFQFVKFLSRKLQCSRTREEGRESSSSTSTSSRFATKQRLQPIQ